MILLLGGVSETAPIAFALAARGAEILISTATDFPLEGPFPEGAEFRSGPLDVEGLKRLITDRKIEAIVDATHPYAAAASATARRATEDLSVPYFRFLRPLAADGVGDVRVAADHDEAASLAFSFGRPVLLTTGSRNLAPYVRVSKEKNIALTVRALPSDDSINSCVAAGVMKENIIAARGPFSKEENIETIRRRGIGVVVTKDSGDAGGTLQKIEAARETGCELIIIARPEELSAKTFSSPDDIAAAATQRQG